MIKTKQKKKKNRKQIKEMVMLVVITSNGNYHKIINKIINLYFVACAMILRICCQL